MAAGSETQPSRAPRRRPRAAAPGAAGRPAAAAPAPKPQTPAASASGRPGEPRPHHHGRTDGQTDGQTRGDPQPSAHPWRPTHPAPSSELTPPRCHRPRPPFRARPAASPPQRPGPTALTPSARSQRPAAAGRGRL